MSEQPPKWNIFARELEAILTSHGYRLGLIDNRTPIHPEKVRRLQRSLETPKHFPTLSPTDLDLVIAAFALTPQEALRLRAAVIATSVEALLMNRIPRDEALRAADHIFAIVFVALQERQASLSTIRELEPTETDHAPDLLFDAVLTLLDDATLAQHLAQGISSNLERIQHLRQALQSYTAALHALEALPAAMRQPESWQVWYDEAQRGQRATQSELDDLGA